MSKSKRSTISLKPGEILLTDGSIVSKSGAPRIQSKALHRRPVFIFSGESKTQQNFKSDCDINRIMARFNEKGILPDMIKADPAYGDFSNVPTYEAALMTVNKASEQFAALSAKVRAEFDNDPAKFLAFTADPKNHKEMVRLGLATEIKPTPEPEPQKVVIVNPDGSKSVKPEPTPKG